MAAQTSIPQAQALWYVQTAGRVWGPYSQARLASFVGERRLTEASLVGSHPSGPFGPASRRRELLALFDPSPPPADVPESPPALVETWPYPQAEPAPAAFAPDRPAPPEPVLDRGPRREPEGDRSAPSEAVQTPAAPGRGQATPRAHGPSRALLVWADLHSQAPVAFEAILDAYGAATPVRPGVWLVRAPLDAAALRNDLTRGLGAKDALLVVEAPLDHAAWFNLGQASEREMRRLWSEVRG